MYKPQFKLTCTCNKLPNIPSSDGGTWRRVRVCPWKSKFVQKDEFDKYKVDGKLPNNIFERDNNLPKLLESWAPGFLWLLFRKYYKDYRLNGLQEPDEVKQHTNKFKDNSDCFLDFIKTRIKITDNKKDKELSTDIYRMFANWYKDNCQGKVPKKGDMMEYLSTQEGITIKGNYIFGLKTHDPNEESEVDEIDEVDDKVKE